MPDPPAADDPMIDRRAENDPSLLASNSYVTKKTVAQGMLDFALLMANASQLDTLFRLPVEALTRLHYAMLVLIAFSVILQIAVGILLCILGFRKMRTKEQRNKAEVLNNTVVIMIMIITVFNIFINAFDLNIKNSPVVLDNNGLPVLTGGNNTS